MVELHQWPATMYGVERGHRQLHSHFSLLPLSLPHILDQVQDNTVFVSVLLPLFVLLSVSSKNLDTLTFSCLACLSLVVAATCDTRSEVKLLL